MRSKCQMTEVNTLGIQDGAKGGARPSCQEDSMMMTKGDTATPCPSVCSRAHEIGRAESAARPSGEMRYRAASPSSGEGGRCGANPRDGGELFQSAATPAFRDSSVGVNSRPPARAAPCGHLGAAGALEGRGQEVSSEDRGASPRIRSLVTPVRILRDDGTVMDDKDGLGKWA